MTTAIQVDLPDSLSADEAKVLLAVKLFEVGKASLAQAARLAGFSKRAFIEVLGQHHVPVINYSADELRDEAGL
jgi:predicted HTH domain antitoxin